MRSASPVCLQVQNGLDGDVADRGTVRAVRLAQGISIRTLAFRAVVDPSRLSAWDRGAATLELSDLVRVWMVLAVGAGQGWQRRLPSRAGKDRAERGEVDPPGIPTSRTVESGTGSGYLCTTEAARYCGFKTSGGLRKAYLDGRVYPSGRRGGRGTWMWDKTQLDRFLRGESPSLGIVASFR
jgi:hypothetical protein